MTSKKGRGRMPDLIPAMSLKVRGDQEERGAEGGDRALFQCLGGGSWHFTGRHQRGGLRGDKTVWVCQTEQEETNQSRKYLQGASMEMPVEFMGVTDVQEGHRVPRAASKDF